CARDLADAARDLARQRGHGTAAAVVEDQDFRHAGSLAQGRCRPAAFATPDAGARRPTTISYPCAMEPLDSWNRWSDRMRDRARASSFFRFLLRRFLDDRLLEAAGGLAFTTLFALVPLSMVVFGALSAFPVFDQWSEQLSAYVFSNFVPSSAQAVQGYLRDLSSNTGKLTA